MYGNVTISILHRLKRLGFTDAEFRSMHHEGRGTTSYVAYCIGKEFSSDGQNSRLQIQLRDELDRWQQKFQLNSDSINRIH